MDGVGEEIPISFGCGDALLMGVLHAPRRAPTLGMVIVVGGPQYRVGSHRQFVLLARRLAADGVAVLRFDCRGMGDSDGEFPGFERIAPDIEAAVDFLLARLPSLREVTLWGLCDATAAICVCARRDARITGVALLNPWVHTEQGQARARLKHYYLRRLVDSDALGKIWRREIDLARSAHDFMRNLRRAFGSLVRWNGGDVGVSGNRLAAEMAENLSRFGGRVLIVLSGQDLTGKEFADAAEANPLWRRLVAQSRVTVHHLDEADHTFSRRAWRDCVANWTCEWLGGTAAEQRIAGKLRDLHPVERSHR